MFSRVAHGEPLLIDIDGLAHEARVPGIIGGERTKRDEHCH